jgi:hypothetical protein
MLMTEEGKNPLTILKANEYTPISCKSLYNYLMKIGRPPDRPVLIKFDKEYFSPYRLCPGYFRRSGLARSFFVTTESTLKSCGAGKDQNAACMNITQLKHRPEPGSEVGLHVHANLIDVNATLQVIRSAIARSLLLFTKLEFPLTNVLPHPNDTTPNRLWRALRLYRVLKQEK